MAYDLLITGLVTTAACIGVTLPLLGWSIMDRGSRAIEPSESEAFELLEMKSRIRSGAAFDPAGVIPFKYKGTAILASRSRTALSAMAPMSPSRRSA